MAEPAMVKLRHASPVSGVSWNGAWYGAFNGQVMVPTDAEATLCSFAHGWSRAPAEPTAPPAANVTKISKRVR